MSILHLCLVKHESMPLALSTISLSGVLKETLSSKTLRITQTFSTVSATVLTETSTSCYAWALIPNHVHLLLTNWHNCQSLLLCGDCFTGYAQQFNRRHDRHGYLFQNRYKSFLCENRPLSFGACPLYPLKPHTGRHHRLPWKLLINIRKQAMRSLWGR